MRNFFGSNELKQISLGSTKIVRAYLGTKIVWFPLAPYTFSTSVDRALPLDAWTVIHTYTVQGVGPADIYYKWRFNSTNMYFSAHRRVTCIRVNGATLGRWDHGGDKVTAHAWAADATLSNISLNHGDVITFEGYADAGNNVSLRTITDHEVRVTPR